MDPVGGAAAIVELLKLAIALGKYIKNVKQSSEAKNQLWHQVEQIQRNLEWINLQRQRIEAGNPAAESFDKILYPVGEGKWQRGSLLQAVDELFEKLKKSLDVIDNGKDEDKVVGKMNMLSHALKWPFKEKEVKEMAEVLHRYNEQIHQILIQANFQTGGRIWSISEKMSGDVDKLGENMKYVIEKMDSIHDNVEIPQLEKRVVKMLNWLYSGEHYDPGLQIPKREQIPCDWLLRDDVFEAWCRGRSWPLFLYGEPGCGKTMLSSLLADYLRSEQMLAQSPTISSVREGKILVLSLFLKYEERAAQSVNRLLGSLLRQSLSRYDTISLPSEVMQTWQKASREHRRLDVTDAIGLLKSEISKSDHTYIIVDGLDESLESVRDELLLQLENLQSEVNQTDIKLRLLYTSRPKENATVRNLAVCDICHLEDLRIFFQCTSHESHGTGFHLCQKCADSNTECDLREPKSVDYQLKPPNELIEGYVQKLLKTIKIDSEFRQIANRSPYGITPLGGVLGGIKDVKKREELELDIVKAIVKSAKGSFLLAKAQWDHVKTASKPSEVRRHLRDMPLELSDTYETALKRIKNAESTESKRGLKLLMWLSYSKRVMGYRELEHAMTVELEEFLEPSRGVDPEERANRIFNPEETVDLNFYLTATAGLVHMSEGGTVRLMHETAYAYLSNERVREMYFGEIGGHRDIALISLAYLRYTSSSHICEGDDEEEQLAEKLNKLPFAAYASQFWGSHASFKQEDETIAMKIREFLEDESLLAASVQLSGFCESFRHPTGWDVRKGVSAIHVAAWFGLDSTIEYLASNPLDADCIDSTGFGRTPLMYACRKGNSRTVAKLLQLGASINRSDTYNNFTPLRHAISFENLDVLKELCGHDDLQINSLSPHPENVSALMAAAEKGNGELMFVLVQARNVDINLRDSDGCSALFFSVADESLKAMEVLIGATGIDIDAPDNRSETVLHRAAFKGKPAVVSRLLRAGSNVYAKNSQGFTPLMWAVLEGHVNVVEEFYKNSHISTSEMVAKNGWTLLHGACYWGHTAIVRWLLQHGSEIDAVDARGRTCLHLAATTGRKETVKILLQAGADRTIRNSSGEVPLDVALHEGFFEIVSELEPSLSAEKATFDENSLSTEVLAKRGYADTLGKRLRESPDSISQVDMMGDTPLHHAVRERKIDCIQVILEHARGKDLAGVANAEGISPLRVACKDRRSAEVKLLLSQDAKPELETPDASGNTLLDTSLMYNDFESAVALIAAGADIQNQGTLPSGLLQTAIEEKNKTVVESLLQHGIRVGTSDILQATQSDDQEIVGLLRRNRTWKSKVPNASSLQRVASSPLLEQADSDEEDSLLRRLQADDLRVPQEELRTMPNFSKPAFRQREAPLPK